MKIVFVIANSVDPDEMPHYAVSHLGLHCDTVCQRMHLGVTGIERVNSLPTG